MSAATIDPREAWLAERQTGIGSSDAAAAVGLNPYETPLELWLRLTKRMGPKQQTVKMLLGLRLEEVVAAVYAEKLGVELINPGLKSVAHPKIPWMRATIDRERPDNRRIVEIKTGSPYVKQAWGEPGTDDIPEYHLIQVLHQMAVRDAPGADVVCYILGAADIAIYQVERNDAAIDALVEKEAAFWKMVETDLPPPPDWKHPATARLIGRLYGVDESKTIELGQDAAELVGVMDAARDGENEQKRLKDEAKAKLLYLMGEASLAILPDGRRLTRKNVDRKAYSVEATTYVDFRIKEGMKRGRN